jgi:hypothetical protein
LLNISGPQKKRGKDRLWGAGNLNKTACPQRARRHVEAEGLARPAWLKMKNRVAECQKSSPEWLSEKCKLLFRASVIWLMHPLPVLPYVWNSQEADMALQPHRLEFKPHRFEFILAMVLAMALTILAITTWAAPANPDNDSAASIPPIYRPDHRNLY